ncbi:hypothetical protein DCAR_0312135 [Daucus carota subsp. sativus]|uniref:Protein kinase domain-containing protein n=1 Tax=Daucus carota subsp. sativus TaxID=79200 RepID=A0AAF0WQY6_DAUCS|nr:hypothetical protein DCAR_0312135 [Daucus carota subsp. sativus]
MALNPQYRISRPPGLLIALAILPNLCLTSLSDILPAESEILLRFKATLSNQAALSSWNETRPPCPTGNWVGVHCVDNNVRGLRLQNLGLKGKFKVDVLKDLKGLRTVSIMGNQLEGEFPDFRVLGALKNVYVSDNKFSGVIQADAFRGMISMKKFHAARNRFNGSIPESLVHLPRLKELRLENNKFSGHIPNFEQKNLTVFNVSHNELEGQIPARLVKFNETSFLGNYYLCGGPMGACRASWLRLPVVICVAIAVAAVITIVAALVILRRRKKRKALSAMSPGNTILMTSSSTSSSVTSDLDMLEHGHPSKSRMMPSLSTRRKSHAHNNSTPKLTFLRDDGHSFGLSDLLSASAEILGSGVLGSTYKAVMNNGSSAVMVVKKFAKMNEVGREEFQEHMRWLGKLSHPNILPLVAYYYRKEEKLLVFDYVANVSLAVHLHGGGKKLDWPKRLKIIKGVARGLQYLYNELPSLIAPHGHLKSANVVLNEEWEPQLTDYALSRIVNQEDTQDLMIAYKSPEYKQLGRISKKTDVWSLGMLILEILTGRFPANMIQQGKGVADNAELATWVETLVRENENWKNKVFDRDMMTDINGVGEEEHQEMLKLLKIGLACCEMDVEKRLDIKEAVERIEDVKGP